MAKQHLKPDEMVILVVGDAATYRPKLEALGYEVVDVSEKGDILETINVGIDDTSGNNRM